MPPLDNDTRGRGKHTDDSRIERPNMRPIENPGGGDEPPGPGSRDHAPPPDPDDIPGRVNKILEDSKNEGPPMNDRQSYAFQLQWMQNTRRNLQDLQSEMVSVAKMFDDAMEALAADQYLRECYSKLQPLHQEFISECRETVIHIEDVHIGYLKQQQKVVEEAARKILGR